MPAKKMRDFLAVALLMTVGAIKRAFFLAARWFLRVLSTEMPVLVDRNLEMGLGEIWLGEIWLGFAACGAP